MSERMFICKKGWKRHPKGHVINEWEWKRLAIESREQYFEEYFSSQEPGVVTSKPKPVSTEVFTEVNVDATQSEKHELSKNSSFLFDSTSRDNVRTKFKYENDGEIPQE